MGWLCSNATLFLNLAGSLDAKNEISNHRRSCEQVDALLALIAEEEAHLTTTPPNEKSPPATTAKTTPPTAKPSNEARLQQLDVQKKQLVRQRERLEKRISQLEVRAKTQEKLASDARQAAQQEAKETFSIPV